jgi:zinc transport system ATP-binding protein
MVNILEVSNLSVQLGGATILDDVNFVVPRGASLAVIGPNGAGKTVLLRALIGSVAASGTIRWADGVRLGYVPQKLDLDRDVPLTGRDFLHASVTLTRASKERLYETAALVGLTAGALAQPIGTLSGGQFQRLLIAFALIGDPTVLLLDEPTAGVDEPGQERLNELVHRLQCDRGLTVLLVSHELSVVHRYATVVLCLSHGRAWVGPPQQTLTNEGLREIYGAPIAHHVHNHAHDR